MAKDIEKIEKSSGGSSGAVRKAAEKASEFIRDEATTAIPAAQRAATHAAKVFWRRFLQEYRKEKSSGASPKKRAIRKKSSTGETNE